MTNFSVPNASAELGPELLALAPVGGKRRPVKVFEHPAFRDALLVARHGSTCSRSPSCR